MTNTICFYYMEDDHIAVENPDDTWSIVHDHAETTEWIETATTHKAVCTYCDKTMMEEEAHERDNCACLTCSYACVHEGGKVTCIDKAVCDTCKASYGELDKDDHVSDAFTYTDCGLTHAKLHSCCGEREVYEGHAYENGSCICGASEPAKKDSDAGEVIRDIVEISYDIIWRNLALLIINAITYIFG